MNWQKQSSRRSTHINDDELGAARGVVLALAVGGAFWLIVFVSCFIFYWEG